MNSPRKRILRKRMDVRAAVQKDRQEKHQKRLMEGVDKMGVSDG